MGRSRGGPTTKIHALADARGLPILLKLTEGQAHDGRSAQDMLGTLGRGDVLLGDRAYDSDALRQDLAVRGARANVRLMPNRTNLAALQQTALSPAQSGRTLLQQTQAFQNFRAIATRYDKRDDNYLASVKLASIRIWMRFSESMA
jgi:transposase